MVNYSKLIKRIRNQKKFTIRELAKEMGLTEPYLEKTEREEVKPTEEQTDLILYYVEGRIDEP